MDEFTRKMLEDQLALPDAPDMTSEEYAEAKEMLARLFMPTPTVTQTDDGLTSTTYDFSGAYEAANAIGLDKLIEARIARQNAMTPKAVRDIWDQVIGDWEENSDE